ncbi:MAG TPA: hypothetical protein VGJ00_05610 [Rhabdochlamydiaceae bacterium]|jgi:hypothetical protein
MIKMILWLLGFVSFFIQGVCSYSIVFVHIGKTLPKYLYSTVAQARLFNEECPIFLVANQVAIRKANPSLRNLGITFIPCESLTPSKTHTDFVTNSEQDWSCKGLWVYSSERFFYLEELMREYSLSDVFHIESDVLLYANLEDLLPVFKKRYNGMLGAIFENDHRCVPSIVYVADLAPIKALINFYPKKVHVLHADMDIIADFKDRYYRVFIDFLPITVSGDGKDNPFVGALIQSKTPELYSNNIEEFNAIFDGAAFGIYFAGRDPRWHRQGPGTISEYSVINPSAFALDWKMDDKGRRVPLVSHKNKQLPLVNLHITNKSMIDQFLSIKKN